MWNQKWTRLQHTVTEEDSPLLQLADPIITPTKKHHLAQRRRTWMFTNAPLTVACSIAPIP
jgi:hypothetical protein